MQNLTAFFLPAKKESEKQPTAVFQAWKTDIIRVLVGLRILHTGYNNGIIYDTEKLC
jgi:hypothetical protein